MKERRSVKKLIIGFTIFALSWIAVFAVLHFSGKLLGDEPSVEATGSLEGRFLSSVQYEYNGRQYAYRDSSISTLLLIGIDKEDVTSGSGYRSGGQADFMILLVADSQSKTVTPIQLDRDTITPVKMMSVFGKSSGVRAVQLCLAQSFGKNANDNCLNTVWSVSNLLCGIPIDDYIAIDMSAISLVNDSLGGITVTLDEDLTEIDPYWVKGNTILLQGSMSERYVRARMSVSDGTNNSRMRRQRLYLDSLEKVLMNRLNADSGYIGTLYDLLGNNMVTDMSRGALINTSYRLSKYSSADTVTFTGRYETGSTGFNEFYPDEAQLTKIVLDLCFKQIK